MRNVLNSSLPGGDLLTYREGSMDMISSQVIRTSIEELKSITKVDLCVLDLEGNIVASTFK